MKYREFIKLRDGMLALDEEGFCFIAPSGNTLTPEQLHQLLTKAICETEHQLEMLKGARHSITSDIEVINKQGE